MAENMLLGVLCTLCLSLLIPNKSLAFTFDDLPQAAMSRHRVAYIIGGGNADQNLWTWQAALEVLDPFTRTYSPVCGAALISSQWLVTATHCIDHTYGALRADPKNYKVVLGAYDLNNPSGSEVIVNAEKFVTHKGFILDFNAGFPNDIGLIQLSEPVDLAKHGLEPISLPEGHEDFSGAPCYITGWGKTKADENHAIFTGVLQQADATIVPNDPCKAVMTDAGAPGILSTHICVGGLGGKATACEGDSGSPLSCKVNGKWKLAGIYSWYAKCEDLPSVYTRVPSFIGWISTHIMP